MPALSASAHRSGLTWNFLIQYHGPVSTIVVAATDCVKVTAGLAVALHVPITIELAIVAASEAEPFVVMLPAVILVRTHSTTLAPAATAPVFVTVAAKVPVTAPERIAAVVQLAVVPTSTVTADRRVADADVAEMARLYVPSRLPVLVIVTTPTAVVTFVELS